MNRVDSAHVHLEMSEVEIPVTVGGTTRWMQGLTKLTTCDDIVYSLLVSIANPAEGDPGSVVDNYGLFETYGDQERKLSGRAKVLRVWSSWGAESSRVRFSLRKLRPEACVRRGSISSEHSVSRVCGRREMRTKQHERPTVLKRDPTQPLPEHLYAAKSINPSSRGLTRVEGICSGTDIPKGYVSRVVPQNNYHPMSRSSLNYSLPDPRRPSPTPENDDHKEASCQLMRLILEQEKRVQEITSRISDIDNEIENYETNVHYARMAAEGPNYLQNAYLSGTADSPSRTKLGTDISGASSDDLQKYLLTCESLLAVSGRLEQERGKIEDFSLQLQEDESFMETVVQPPSISSDFDDTYRSDDSFIVELADTKRSLEDSIIVYGKNTSQMSSLSESLRECEEQLVEKRMQLSQLEELDRVSCETIQEEDSEISELDERPPSTLSRPSSDSAVEDDEDIFTTSHLEFTEPVCSSTPHITRTNMNNSKTSKYIKSTSFIGTPPPLIEGSIYDPSLTVLASDPNNSSLYGALLHTALGARSPGSDTDTTSDTGLSSMHSTTSEDVAFNSTLETLV